MQETQETQVWFLSQKDPLEVGMATHSRYSCLENSMDRDVCQATVHQVAKESNTTEHIYAHISGITTHCKN